MIIMQYQYKLIKTRGFKHFRLIINHRSGLRLYFFKINAIVNYVFTYSMVDYNKLNNKLIDYEYLCKFMFIWNLRRKLF